MRLSASAALHSAAAQHAGFMGAGCFKPADDWDGDVPFHGGVQCGDEVLAHTTANGVQFGQAPHADHFFFLREQRARAGAMKAASRLLQRVMSRRSGGGDFREISTPAWARVRRESLLRDYETFKEIAVKIHLTHCHQHACSPCACAPARPSTPAPARSHAPAPARSRAPRPRFFALLCAH